MDAPIVVLVLSWIPMIVGFLLGDRLERSGKYDRGRRAKYLGVGATAAVGLIGFAAIAAATLAAAGLGLASFVTS